MIGILKTVSTISFIFSLFISLLMEVISDNYLNDQKTLERMLKTEKITTIIAIISWVASFIFWGIDTTIQAFISNY